MTRLAVFNQMLGWLEGTRSLLSREAIQWLRPLVERVNTISPEVGSLRAVADASLAQRDELAADGSAISRADYAELFALIGTTYGAGNGTTTFNLPNLTAATPSIWLVRSL